MRNAILIGFEYANGKKLPGITIDLYLFYSFLKKNHWNDSEIIIYTDIKKDSHTEILKTAISEKIVDSDILSFFEEIKEKKQYIEFTSHNHYNNFDFVLRDSKTENLFVYYSGHCKNSNLILPNESLISLINFKNILIKYSEVICIMDCCSCGFDLPFVCHENENIYRLNSNSFITSKIISIVSSLDNENSITSKIGSYFTKNLYSILSNEMSLFQILDKLKNKGHYKNFKQTANISVSYPNLYFLFPWLYSKPSLSIVFTPHYIEILL